MKKLVSNVIWISLIFICISFVVGCSSKECQHTYGEWKTVREATCTVNGIREKICSKCGHAEQEDISSTGHRFGDWMPDGDNQIKRVCAICGDVERSYTGDNSSNSGNSNSNDNINNNNNNGSVDNFSNGRTEYRDFDKFKSDCLQSGNMLTYNGVSNNITVALNSSVGSCDDYTIVIPSRVGEVIFLGSNQGNASQDLRFMFENRSSDISIYFDNVRVETNGTIISSETKNINFNMKVSGNCSFVNTSRAAKGKNGDDGHDRTTGSDGSRGENGTPCFIINGNCTIDATEASEFIIQGGNGGDGGNGGNIFTGAAFNGGDSGDGGMAVSGDRGTIVYVTVQNQSNVRINGGQGGNPGAGGTSTCGHWGKNKVGSEGNKGKDGGTGCEIIIK